MKAHDSKTAQVCLLFPVTAFAPDSSFTRPRRSIQSSRCTRLLAPRFRQCAAGPLSSYIEFSVLAGLPHTTLAPLQRVINAAVRLVDGLRPRDHVTAAAMALHWLPIEARIQYKLCLLVHLALARKAPTYMYITSLLQPITACPRSMVLRSATDDELFTPRSRLKFGEKAFRISAPKAWNCLPHDIRLEACTNSFKGKLKTFLFERYYC